MKQKINIIWCKRNLRVNDNEILEKLNSESSTLGVYFFEPKIMSLSDYSDFHLQFIFESLLELQKSYIQIGIPLLLLPYDAIQGFQMLQKYFDVQNIFSHEETGNWESYQRDKKVLQYCKKSAIKMIEYPTNGVVRRLKDRDNWHKIWMKRMSQDIFEAKTIKNTIEIPKDLCTISKNTKQKYQEYFKTVGNADLRSLQKGGESEGINILKNFLENRSAKYMYNISKPFESQSWCSRLSPYITYGCLSLKTILQATENKREELKLIGTESAKKHRKSLQYFTSRLHWQSHFIQKLKDEPELEFRNINRDFELYNEISQRRTKKRKSNNFILNL